MARFRGSYGPLLGLGLVLLALSGRVGWAQTPTPAATGVPTSTRTPTAGLPTVRATASPRTTPPASPTPAPTVEPTARSTASPRTTPTASPTPASTVESTPRPTVTVLQPTATATPSEDETAVTPNDGGQLSSRDRTVTVDVPAGAVEQPLRIRYELAGEGRCGDVRIARSFHLTAIDTAGRAVSRFRAPLTLTVKYTSSELSRAGIDETTAGLYYLNESRGAWERLPSEVDEARQQVSGTVDHFSVFAVGGETFEVASGSGNAFSDNFANLLAWTTASGGGTVSSSSLTSSGANGVYDIFVVTNSGNYSDFTYQAQVRDASLNGSHYVGLIGRYQSTSNYYSAVLSGGTTISLYKVVGGTTTLVGSAAQTYSANTPYWLKLDLSGSSIRVWFATNSGGAPGSFAQKISVTDTSLTRGQVGLINANAGGSTRRGIFAGPGVTSSLPQDWGGIVQQTGRPGLIWDKVTAAHGGSGSLQLFGGSSTFVGYAAQTTSNTVNSGAAYTSVAGSRPPV